MAAPEKIPLLKKIENKMRKCIRGVLKFFCYKWVFPLVYKWYARKPIDEKLVIFADDQFKGMTDNFMCMYKICEANGFHFDIFISPLIYKGATSFGDRWKRRISFKLRFMKMLAQCRVLFLANYFSLAYIVKLRPETQIVQLWNLAVFPDSLSYDAAALCEPAAVALHAVNAGQVAPGDTVAVIGSGTIGLLAAMWARLRNAEQVVVIGRGKEKLEAAQALGFSHTVSTLTQDPEEAVCKLTAGQGADVILEMAGSPETVSTAVCCAKKGGTVVLTGNPTGDITLSRGVYWKILRNELQIRGIWNSSYGACKNDWSTALEYTEQGLLQAEKLITHHFPLREWERAFHTLRDRQSGAIKSDV